MKMFFLVAFVVAGTYAQLNTGQQLIFKQQQLFRDPTVDPNLEIQQAPFPQQQLLYPGLAPAQYGGLGLLDGYSPYFNPLLLNNQIYNPYLYNTLTKSPYTPILTPSTFPAPEFVEEIDVVQPTGLSGVVEMDALDAYLQDAKNKNQGHSETYHWQRSGLPKFARSSLGVNRYAAQVDLAQALLKNSGSRPNWWSTKGLKNERSRPPFTVDKPAHAEIYTYQ